MNMRIKMDLGISRALKFTALAILSLLSACNSYHLGSPAEIPFKTVFLMPVSNHSYAPQAQSIVSAQLREDFIQDARTQVVFDKASADAVLFVDLVDYERSATARSSQDTNVADIFDLQITANASLLNQTTGTYIFRNRPIHSTTNAYVSDPYADTSVINY